MIRASKYLLVEMAVPSDFEHCRQLEKGRCMGREEHYRDRRRGPTILKLPMKPADH